MNNQKNIVKGYLGIMDLDLNLVPESQHAEVVHQHYADIDEYKTYQASLPENMRYENTIVKAEKTLAIEREAARQRGIAEFNKIGNRLLKKEH